MSARTATDDVVENCQLVLREREARDLCWWERARDCFHPDSTVNVGWFEGSGAEFVAGSARRGIPVRSDLLGEDQPERVAAFFDEAFAWAGIDPAR